MTTRSPDDEAEDIREVIDLTMDRALCLVHGELFRAKWPSGYPLFMVEGFKRWAQREDVIEESGGEIAGLLRLLDARPMCCRLTPTEMLALYAWINRQHKFALWPRKRCVNCNQVAYGGPFKTTEREFAHICCRCVVRAAQAGPPQLPPKPQASDPPGNV